MKWMCDKCGTINPGNSSICYHCAYEPLSGRHVYPIKKFLDQQKTTCKDCGVETKPGQGSARCKECWDDKVGR